MIVKTKKYKLTTNTYMQLGLRNIVREQWWVFVIALVIVSGTFFVKTIWFVLGTSIGLLLYFLFWIIQFYGITYLEQNKLLFERLRYEISSQHIMIQLTSKQGMPIVWEQVKRATQGKDYFLLVISKAHLIHLPYKIFNSKHEIKFVETILKRKTLI
jgi:YcxB-like protein